MRALVVLVAACATGVPARSQVETLAFHIREGEIDNYFYRRGPIAAHVVLTSGPKPRVLVAFPAGNEGAGLWFEPGEPVAITASSEISPVSVGELRGITMQLTVSHPLVVRQAGLAGVRTLRDFITLGTIAPELAPRVDPHPPITLRRTLRDGKHHLELVLDGAVRVEGGAIHLGAGAPITLTVLSDEAPLTPIETTE